MADPTMIHEAAEIAAVAHETVEAAKAAGPIGAFGLNGKIFVAQLINFGLVLLVLWRFAYRPIVDMLEARSEKIEKSVKQAEEIEERMKAAEAEREMLLKQARLDAQELAEKAEAQTEERRKEMIEKARTEVEKVVAQGKQQLVAEREEMLTHLRKEMAEVAVLAAGKVLGKEVDGKTSEALTKEAFKEIGA